MISRRTCLLLPFGSWAAFAQQKDEFICPMDPDVRSRTPGLCPRCHMRLVANLPAPVEYPVTIATSPADLRPGVPFVLRLRIVDPKSGAPVRHFEMVHERPIHLFLVSESLSYFNHAHPELQPDGQFQLGLKLPFGGMYRLAADFYPSGGLPQLAEQTLFVAGSAPVSALAPDVQPKTTENLNVVLRLDPEELFAGQTTKLRFQLSPADGLELYLGAWGHMLIASGDLIDLIHTHPFDSKPDGGSIVFETVFPRPGLHRCWVQFQSRSVVNTASFTVDVREL